MCAALVVSLCVLVNLCVLVPAGTQCVILVRFCGFGSRCVLVSLSPLICAGSACAVLDCLFLLSLSNLDKLCVLVRTVLCMLYLFMNVLVLAGPMCAVFAESLFLLILCVLVISLTVLFLMVLCVIVQLCLIKLTLLVDGFLYLLLLWA